MRVTIVIFGFVYSSAKLQQNNRYIHDVHVNVGVTLTVCHCCCCNLVKFQNGALIKWNGIVYIIMKIKQVQMEQPQI